MRAAIFAALLCTGVANAQTSGGVWTLERCIRHAQENSISIQENEITLEQGKVSLGSAKMRVLPALSASASENMSFGRGLTADNTYTNSNTTSTSLSLGGEMPLFQGLDIYHGIKIARLDLEAATADLEKARDDIMVNVAQAYIQILYNQEILRVAEHQAEHDATLLEGVSARRDAGKASDADVTAQAANLAQSRSAAIQARGNLDLSVLDLTQLLELPSPEGFEIALPSIESFEQRLLMNPEDIYDEALGIKPAVKAAQMRVESAKTAISRAKDAYIPTLSLSGGLGTSYYTASSMRSSGFSDQVRNNFSQYVGLSLNIPIFDRLTTRNNVRSARLNLQSRELQLENVKKSLYKEIQQAYYGAVASQARNSGCEEAARSALERYELTEEKYLSGKASITDCNDARNSYLSAESERIKSRYECLYQTSLLDFYRGREISL